MRDAVADVLIERRALSRREPGGLAGSLALHAAVLILLVLVSKPRPVEPVQVLTVRLAPAGGTRAAKAPGATVAPPVPRPMEAPKPEEKKSEPAKAPPALKNQETLFGKAIQPKGKDTKTVSKPEPAKPEPVTPGASFADTANGGIGALPGVGAAGITGLEGGDFPYSQYLERMVTLIGANWLRPETGADITTVVYFTIDKYGKITNPEIRKSSGSGVFDRAALRAVIESSPLPSLPFGYRGSFLGVQLTFH